MQGTQTVDQTDQFSGLSHMWRQERGPFLSITEQSLANEKRCYICYVFAHWLLHCLTIVTTMYSAFPPTTRHFSVRWFNTASFISTVLSIISTQWFKIVFDYDFQMHYRHYDDVIMGAMASHITSLMIVYSTVYSGADQSKHQNLRVIGLCGGNSPGTGKFPAQMASNAENVSIWWRHHHASISTMSANAKDGWRIAQLFTYQNSTGRHWSPQFISKLRFRKRERSLEKLYSMVKCGFTSLTRTDQPIPSSANI